MLDTNEIFVRAQGFAPSVKLEIISIALFMKWYNLFVPQSTNQLWIVFRLTSKICISCAMLLSWALTPLLSFPENGGQTLILSLGVVGCNGGNSSEFWKVTKEGVISIHVNNSASLRIRTEIREETPYSELLRNKILSKAWSLPYSILLFLSPFP